MRGQQSANLNEKLNPVYLIPDEYEPMWMTNIKLACLIFFTFGLVVLMFVISGFIERVNGDLEHSYQAGGGILLGLFIVYVILVGVTWHCGMDKREDLKREAVEIAVQREKAMQAMQALE